MKWYKYDINDMSEKLYRKYFSMMSESRKSRIGAKKNKADRLRSVGAEMLLRKAVSELYSVQERQIVIENDAAGAPYLPEQDIYVSISHAESFAFCAISENPVGIDAEKLRDIPSRIAERTFSTGEMSYLGKITDDILRGEQARRFFEIWTAKEAYAKMIRTGISLHNTPDTSTLECIRHEYFKDYVISVCGKL